MRSWLGFLLQFWFREMEITDKGTHIRKLFIMSLWKFASENWCFHLLSVKWKTEKCYAFICSACFSSSSLSGAYFQENLSALPSSKDGKLFSDILYLFFFIAKNTWANGSHISIYIFNCGWLASWSIYRICVPIYSFYTRHFHLDRQIFIFLLYFLLWRILYMCFFFSFKATRLMRLITLFGFMMEFWVSRNIREIGYGEFSGQLFNKRLNWSKKWLRIAENWFNWLRFDSVGSELILSIRL